MIGMSLPRRLTIDLREDLGAFPAHGDDCYGNGLQFPLLAQAASGADRARSALLPRPGLPPDDLLHQAHAPSPTATPFACDLDSHETTTADLLGNAHVSS